MVTGVWPHLQGVLCVCFCVCVRMCVCACGVGGGGGGYGTVLKKGMGLYLKGGQCI